MPGKTYEYDAVQMLLFNDGEAELATIACHMYKYKIVGFRFIYWSGTEESIGMTGGITTEDGLTLYPGEQVIRFVALGAPYGNGLEKIKVCSNPSLPSPTDFDLLTVLGPERKRDTNDCFPGAQPRQTSYDRVASFQV